MNPDDFRAQLEYELAWRQKEQRILTNQLSHIPEEDKKTYCKALLVMLYSHFEGFCKTAFLTYLKLINDEKINRSLATEYVAASSLLDIFHDIEYPNKSNNKYCDLFKITSDETKFSKFFVHAHFIRKLDEILRQEINISDTLSADIVNTESNLSPRVMRRILYRIGLPYSEFDGYEREICNLLKRRNDYAHGDPADGMKEKDYRELEESVYAIISDLITLLTKAAKNKTYLKIATPAITSP